MPPRISVVIPVKDDAEQLEGALEALAAQTLAPWEVVVLDNGSTDGVTRVTAAAGARVVWRPGGGIPSANAAACDAATGEIIARLDADCRPGPEWLARIAEVFAADDSVSAITGGGVFLDGPSWLRRPLATAYLLAYHLTLRPTLGHAPLWGSNLAMRRRAWERVSRRVHRDDPEVHDDLDLSFHLGERHRIRYVRGLHMGVSMRPFADRAALRRRFVRGFHSVFLHWPRDFPPVRCARVLLVRVTRRTLQ